MNILQMIKKINSLLDGKTKIQLVGIFILTVIGSVVELIGVAIVMPIIELAMGESYVQANIFARTISRIFGISDKESIILTLIAFTIAIYVFKAIYMLVLTAVQFHFSMRVKGDLSVKLLKAFLSHPYEFFLSTKSGELMRTIGSDTNEFYEVVTNILMVASSGITAIAIGAYLMVTNIVIALFIVALLLLCAIFIISVLNKKFQKYGEINHEYSAILNKAVLQTFNGVKEIKIIGNEHFFINTYSDTFKKQAKTNSKFKIYSVLPKQLTEVVCIAGILLYMAYSIMFTRDYVRVVAQIAVFCVGAYKLLPSINAIISYIGTIIYNMASVDCIYNSINDANDYLKNHAYSLEDKNQTKLCLTDNIFGENLSFKYCNSNNYILKNVNITVRKGEAVGFIGKSGGGKTTLADILIGLLKPENGRVLIDGIDIERCQKNIGTLIGYIPQAIYLTDDSIRNNIAFGIKEDYIDDEMIWDALKKAQLDEFVRTLPNGLDTEVGERGTKLSGGQRQRIGIARALYRDPDVLVLDEATSALDNDTEAEVMKAVNGLKGSKTVIMIAHRISTIKNCDRIYEVKQGKVVERQYSELV